MSKRLAEPVSRIEFYHQWLREVVAALEHEISEDESVTSEHQSEQVLGAARWMVLEMLEASMVLLP